MTRLKKKLQSPFYYTKNKGAKQQKQSEKTKNTLSFTTFYHQESMRTTVRESTRRNHLSTLALLRDFKKDVGFEELTFSCIANFEYFLYTRRMCTNTVAKHLRHLKRYVNSAIHYGYIEAGESPFRNYRIKTEATRCHFLSPQEVETLERLRLEKGKNALQQTLDVFLFCCYTGLRYSDFKSLQPENIVSLSDETWLMYRSPKTGAEQKLPLHLLFQGKGELLLKKYRGSLTDFFHLQDNSNMNKKLAKIASMAGIRKMTFHVARHTNATLLLHKGVNIAVVQYILGHKSIKTTQIYAHMMNETLVSELKKAFGI